MAVIANLRKTAMVFAVLLAIDLLFAWLAMFGMYSIPGQIAMFFFSPAIAIGDRVTPFLHLPRGVNSMADIFVVQLMLLALVTFLVLALKKGAS